MRNLPEMFMLVSLIAALLGFGTTSPALARAGQSLFIASVIFVMVAMMLEDWRVGPPPRGSLV